MTASMDGDGGGRLGQRLHSPIGPVATASSAGESGSCKHCAGSCGTHSCRERPEVVGPVVPAAVDEEGGCAGDAAQVGAVDVVGDACGTNAFTEVVGETNRVEAALL